MIEPVRNMFDSYTNWGCPKRNHEVYVFYFNRQILLNAIPARRKVWTKQDTNGAAYIR